MAVAILGFRTAYCPTISEFNTKGVLTSRINYNGAFKTILLPRYQLAGGFLFAILLKTAGCYDVWYWSSGKRSF